MVKVALAGATTGLGLNVLKALIASKKHSIVLLSRGPKPEFSAKGVDVHAVDYNDHQSLVDSLQGVHTVIVLIGTFDESLKTTQLALLKAAKEAGVRRFAPSEFAVHKTGASATEPVDGYKYKGPVWEAVKSSGLEYTNFAPGLFMNVFCTGTPRGEAKALEGLRPWNFVVNMKAGTAEIPGDGNQKVTFTTIKDTAKFVVASLDLEKWDEESGMVGTTMTYNQVVLLIERVTGRKLLVKYRSIEEMQEAAMSDNMIVKFANQVQIVLAKNGFEIVPNLNEKCPDVRPWGLEAWLVKWWKGVDLPESAWSDEGLLIEGEGINLRPIDSK